MRTLLRRELSGPAQSDIELWTARIGGAFTEAALYRVAAGAGLVGGRILERFDCYEGTRVKTELYPDLCAQGVNFFARKPDTKTPACKSSRSQVH